MDGIDALQAALWPVMAPLVVGAAVLLVLALWLAGPPLAQAWRRARVRRQPFPKAWRDILRQRMPAFAQLPADVQLRLKKKAQVLIAEKPFIGCAGLVVNDEMRVLIAVQAALLIQRRGAGYFDTLRQILVYPGAFAVQRSQTDAAGLVHEQRQVMLGEAWSLGQVVLSWQDVLAGAADPGDGHNVVIHEFAHVLDQQKGRANGAPPWPGAAGRRWAQVMQQEFDALHGRLLRGEAGLIDAYGATDPAEFFAVISELFFEKPAELAAQHAAVFAQLRAYYGADPLLWRG